MTSPYKTLVLHGDSNNLTADGFVQVTLVPECSDIKPDHVVIFDDMADHPRMARVESASGINVLLDVYWNSSANIEQRIFLIDCKTGEKTA